MLFYKLQLSYFKSYKILNFSYNHLANKRGITVNKIKIEKFVQGKINIKYYKNRHFQNPHTHYNKRKKNSKNIKLKISLK